MPTPEQRAVLSGEYYKRIALDACHAMISQWPAAPERQRLRMIAGYARCLTTDVLEIIVLDDKLLDNIRLVFQEELNLRRTVIEGKLEKLNA